MREVSRFANDYQLIAASQSGVLLQGSADNPSGGVTESIIERLLIIPASTSPGAVTISDGGRAAITVFAGGSSSLADLRPFWVEVGARAGNGGWNITTGSNVSVLAVGRFC